MPSTIKYLTRQEMSKLLKSVEDRGKLRDIAIFHVAYYLALRVSEVGMLLYQDFTEEGQEIYVHRLKGSVSGARRLDSKRFKVLMDYLKTRSNIGQLDPLFPSRQKGGIKRSRLHELVKKYGKTARIPEGKRHFHVFRHSMAVHAMDARAMMQDVQWLLGHKTIMTTMIYASFTTHQQDEFYNNLNRRSELLA